ncbi:MAG: ribbon-helix-helix protein, CopG family, partial [Spirochaeta sp.]|nr:ribbon-helix-helix protein, CopG family [Spirochaeta sp.]
MKQITVRVNNDLVGELDRVAERMGRTRAAVVRVAIDRFVEDAWAADDTLSNDRREEVPRNPYARTRPTPLEDRERNLHERTVRRARERQRDLLARLEGRHLEAEPVGCEPAGSELPGCDPTECEAGGAG